MLLMCYYRCYCHYLNDFMGDKSHLTCAHLIYKINTQTSERALLLAGFWLCLVAGCFLPAVLLKLFEKTSIHSFIYSVDT